MENLVPVFYSLNLGPYPARQHQPNHFVVAHERPEWMLKSSRSVLLNKEVSDPRGSVSRDQAQKK